MPLLEGLVPVAYLWEGHVPVADVWVGFVFVLQVGTSTSLELLEDSLEREVDEMAGLLGLRKVRLSLPMGNNSTSCAL